MKKLLGLLAATGLVASTGATVVACNDPAATAVELSIAADKAEITAKLTVTFVKDAKFEFASDKTTASILEVSATDVTAEAQESTITFKVKADAKREADVTEKITVKYNSAEVQVYNVKIAKVAATADVELKIADIKAAVVAKNIPNTTADLAAYNVKLAEITDIEGIASLVAADKTDGTTGDVVVTATAKAGYKLDSGTFELTGAFGQTEA